MQDKMLVPDRGCGDCVECCHALSVDAPTLTKPNGVTCPHICSAGCSIYAARPSVCREWHCAWRMSETLDEAWRPDRSGFIVEIMVDDIPDGFSAPGIRFTLLRSTADALWPPFVDLVTRAIAIRQPVYLCLVGPPGHLAARSFLNVPALVAAVHAGDRNAIEHCLRRAGDQLDRHRWERKSA